MEKELFEVVCWPESQALLEMEGFEENAYLINDEKGMLEFGPSAFFVRKEWLNAIESNDKNL